MPGTLAFDIHHPAKCLAMTYITFTNMDNDGPATHARTVLNRSALHVEA